MELHLFRHGETNWNVEQRAQSHNGSKLTKPGIKQAEKVGKNVKNIRFDKIFCSSSLRARQTAECIWPDEKREIFFWDELREIELGPWEGRLYSDIKSENPTAHDCFFYQPDKFYVEGAETFERLTDRAYSAIQKIAENNHKKCIAVVSHGAFIKALLTRIEGKKLNQIWEPPFMHNCAHNIVNFDKSFDGTITQYADKSEW